MQRKKREPRAVELLSRWYSKNKRDLPWRNSEDPYKIWISEVMSQQTTLAAVIPYYENLLSKFPDVQTLAKAPLKDVLNAWSGLGYYSRARNLYQTAQIFATSGFPQSYRELISLPGFGPYTARALASLAFGEAVGVVDGNVIRVLSRFKGLHLEWWKSRERSQFQELADDLVKGRSSAMINQALMDLGSMICTPSSPKCPLCPWLQDCVANKEGRPLDYPKKRPKRSKETWIWKPNLFISREKIWLSSNDYAPFLRGSLLPPGTAKIVKSPPKKYKFKHAITHHEIYVLPKLSARKVKEISRFKLGLWVAMNKISEQSPSSLLKKLMKLYELQ